MKKIKEKTHKKRKKDAIQEAIDFGIDVTLLYERIPLTPTERLDRNLQALEFAEELRRAGKKKYGKG
ncbi:MAG: hypothetical protein ACRDFC_02915 [Ignavibacteria bacterium]